MQNAHLFVLLQELCTGFQLRQSGSCAEADLEQTPERRTSSVSSSELREPCNIFIIARALST